MAGRHKIYQEEVKQRFFSFSITPRTDEERFIVAALEAMRKQNTFSPWIRQLMRDALLQQTTPRRTITPVYIASGNEPVDLPVEEPRYDEPEPIA